MTNFMFMIIVVIVLAVIILFSRERGILQQSIYELCRNFRETTGGTERSAKCE